MSIEARPWGSYEVLAGGDNEGYKVKRLVVNPGAQLSLQRHQHRSEHWVVLSGHGEIICGLTQDTLRTTFIHPSSYCFIPRGYIHRLVCHETSSEPLQIIEIQRGKYLGEDDIERLQDDYGRLA